MQLKQFMTQIITLLIYYIKHFIMRNKLPRLMRRSEEEEEVHSTISSQRHLLMTDTLEKSAILTTCWDLSKKKKLHSCANWPLSSTAIHATPLSEHNLFRFTDTKTAFVTCQLSAVPPLGHWFLEGVHPARLRSHPGAATLSLLAWRRQLSSLQF